MLTLAKYPTFHAKKWPLSANIFLGKKVGTSFFLKQKLPLCSFCCLRELTRISPSYNAVKLFDFSYSENVQTMHRKLIYFCLFLLHTAVHEPQNKTTLLICQWGKFTTKQRSSSELASLAFRPTLPKWVDVPIVTARVSVRENPAALCHSNIYICLRSDSSGSPCSLTTCSDPWAAVIASQHVTSCPDWVTSEAITSTTHHWADHVSPRVSYGNVKVMAGVKDKVKVEMKKRLKAQKQNSKSFPVGSGFQTFTQIQY